MTSQVVSNFSVEVPYATVPGVSTTTEGALDGLNTYVNWTAFAGTQMKAALSGRFQVGVNPIIVRVRVGHIVNTSGSVGGTVVLEATLPADTTTDLALIGDPFSTPAGVYASASMLTVTVQSVGGSSDLTASGVGVQLVPLDSPGAGLMLARHYTGIAGGDIEWLVDLDIFEGVSDLRVGFAYETAVGASAATYEVWLGGSPAVPVGFGGLQGQRDGTLAVVYEQLAGPSPVLPGHNPTRGAVATVSKGGLAGPQYVKFVGTGGSGTSGICVILREA